MRIRGSLCVAALMVIAPISHAHISSAGFAIQMGAGRDSVEVGEPCEIEYRVDAPYGKKRKFVTLNRHCPAGERQLDSVSYPRDFSLDSPSVDGTYEWHILVNGKEVEHGTLTFARPNRR